jgi:outer membrane assembly lipoprotein YfiO
MKKLIFILLLVLLLPVNAHAFWILSPTSKTIKNADKQFKGNPAANMAQALKEFEKKNYKKTYIICRFIAKKHPDAVEASEAQYYMGRSMEELKNLFEAYLSYQKILESYPNSKRINEVIEREYAIAETLAAGKNTQVMGLKKYDFTEHPSITIFRSLAEKAPGSDYASKAQYQLGMLYFNLKRYDEAKDAFTRLIDKYPDSVWYAPAKYQLAQAVARGFSGTDYDTASVTEATSRLDEFLSSHPDSDVASQASESLKNLNEKAAQKSYETGFFYESRKKYKAAGVYYNIVLDKYPRTSWAEKADAALKRVEGKE